MNNKQRFRSYRDHFRGGRKAVSVVAPVGVYCLASWRGEDREGLAGGVDCRPVAIEQSLAALTGVTVLRRDWRAWAWVGWVAECVWRWLSSVVIDGLLVWSWRVERERECVCVDWRRQWRERKSLQRGESCLLRPWGQAAVGFGPWVLSEFWSFTVFPFIFSLFLLPLQNISFFVRF